MSSSPPPSYDNATDISRFHDLIAYASTHGAYLLQNSQYQIFDITYENSQNLNYILTEFTIPIATRNIRAIRRLRSIQISNLREANRAYDRLLADHPRLLQRIHQEHYPGQHDSPTPMRILSPPTSLSSSQIEIDTIIPTTNTNVITNVITRTNRRRRCYKCNQTSHIKQDCPRYRCMNCRRLQPGHLTNNCPDIPLNDHEYDLGHDYDPDGNLNGEQ